MKKQSLKENISGKKIVYPFLGRQYLGGHTGIPIRKSLSIRHWKSINSGLKPIFMDEVHQVLYNSVIKVTHKTCSLNLENSCKFVNS